MGGTKYKVSPYLPKIGFLVERYSGKIDHFNKVSSFSCIVFFNCPTGIPATSIDINESLLYAKEVCAALNTMEAAKIKEFKSNKKQVKLTKENTAFILWCLGYIYSLSDKLDKRHQDFIEKNHNSVIKKIGMLHENGLEDRRKK